MMAIRHARENTEIYGADYQDTTMVWEPVSEAEEEEFYDIKLSFRPAGSFTGKPGLEQFVISKTVAFVLSAIPPWRRPGCHSGPSAMLHPVPRPCPTGRRLRPGLISMPVIRKGIPGRPQRNRQDCRVQAWPEACHTLVSA